MTGKTKILVIAGGVVGVIAIGFFIYKVVEAVKEVKEEQRIEAEKKAAGIDSEDYGDVEGVDSPESHFKAPGGVSKDELDRLVEEQQKSFDERLKRLQEKRMNELKSADISIIDAVDPTYDGEFDEIDSYLAHEEAMMELYPDMDPDSIIIEEADELDYSDDIPYDVMSDEPESFMFDIDDSESDTNVLAEMSDEELMSDELCMDNVFIPAIKNDVESPEGWRELKDRIMCKVYDMNNRIILDRLFEYEWRKPIPVHKEDVDVWWFLKRNLTMWLGNSATRAQKVTIAHMIVNYATTMTQHAESIVRAEDVPCIDDYVSHILGQIGLSSWPSDVLEVDLKLAKVTGHMIDSSNDNLREWGMFGVDLMGEKVEDYGYGIPFSAQFKLFLEQYL